MGYWYRTGTISVANGSTTVTGTLTGFASAVRTGDMLHAGNNPAVEIASVTDNTHFELVQPWSYATLSSATYGTELGPAWNDVTRLANEVATALASQNEILGGIGAPSDSLGSEGDRYFQDDAPLYYVKGEATWGSPINIKGETGDTGATGATGATGPANSLAIGTITTGTPGGSASATITGTAPSQTLNMTIPRGATGATGTTGAQGPANSLSIGTVTTGAAGSSADATITGTAPSQTLNLTIPKGDAGTNGANGADGTLVNSTSVTSFTPVAGSKAFTVLPGLSYVAGQKLRGASQTNPTTNWFIGIVTAYSGTTLTITVTDIGPTPLAATDWNISLTGETGPAGSISSINGLSGPTVTMNAGDIPDTDTPTYYAPTASTVRGHLQGLDAAVGNAGVASAPQGRLTLTSGTPVTTSDVTGGTSVYYTPNGGLFVPLYDGTKTTMTSILAEISLALDSASGHTGYHQSGKNFDLFVFNDSGTMRLGSGPAWTSNTARGTGAGTTELESKNGFLVNKNSIVLRWGSSSGNITTVAVDKALYVGSFRATADGQATDSAVNRFLFNAYNQAIRPFYRTDAASSWNRSSGGWRQANGSTSNQVAVLAGLAVATIDITYSVAVAQNSSSTLRGVYAAIGVDSATTPASFGANAFAFISIAASQQLVARFTGAVPLGYHFYAALEQGDNGGSADVITWYSAVFGYPIMAISGSILL